MWTVLWSYLGWGYNCFCLERSFCRGAGRYWVGFFFYSIQEYQAIKSCVYGVGAGPCYLAVWGGFVVGRGGRGGTGTLRRGGGGCSSRGSAPRGKRSVVDGRSTRGLRNNVGRRSLREPSRNSLNKVVYYGNW